MALKRMAFLLALAMAVLQPAAFARAGDSQVEYLYVQSAYSGTVDGDILVLKGVAHTVSFSDRPDRIAGVMPNEVLAGQWPNDDPPNATLAILADPPASVVLELMDPVVTGDVVSYKVRVLGGELPERMGPCALFIDPDTVAPMITD